MLREMEERKGQTMELKYEKKERKKLNKKRYSIVIEYTLSSIMKEGGKERSRKGRNGE